MKPTVVIAIAVVFAGLTSCNRSQNQPATVAGGDPASGNLAPVDQAAAPAPQADAPPASAPVQPADSDSYAAPSDDAAVAPSADAVEAPEPPPPLPEYQQPPCPGDDYLWTPGYWDYANAGYYWVPGAWVMSPYVGALWTPPWWGYENRVYVRHTGYWGPHIGFYGGINYGFGYTGRGYYGAYWNSGKVFYNRSVTKVNVTVVHNIYNYSVAPARGERVSYNGGHGGISVRPTVQETAVLRDRRMPPVAAQIQHVREASSNREQFSAGGHPQPRTLVTAQPLATEYHAPAPRPAEPAASHASRPEPQATQPERSRVPAARPAQPEARPAAPEPRADRTVRPETPPRPVSQGRPATQEQRPAPAAHPAQPAERPAAPESRADRTVRPETPPRPVPQGHPATQEQRPAPAAHPAQPAARPAPPPHEAPQVHPAPQDQHRTPPPPPKDNRKGQ
jgi:hypothetical protein